MDTSPWDYDYPDGYSSCSGSQDDDYVLLNLDPIYPVNRPTSSGANISAAEDSQQSLAIGSATGDEDGDAGSA